MLILPPAFDFGVPSSLVIGDLSIAIHIEEGEQMRLGNLSRVIDPSNLDGLPQGLEGFPGVGTLVFITAVRSNEKSCMFWTAAS